MNHSRKIFLAVVLGTLTSLSLPAVADDSTPPRVSHFEAKRADSMEGTVANLLEANGQLKELLGGEVGEYDMHDIHSLSYTLEEALQRIAEEVKALQDVVEDMHLASEGLKRDAVIKAGEDYLERIGKIVR